MNRDYREMYENLNRHIYENALEVFEQFKDKKVLTEEEQGLILGLYQGVNICNNEKIKNEIWNNKNIDVGVDLETMVDYIEQTYIFKEQEQDK